MIAARRRRGGKRGPRREIIGEGLVRAAPGQDSELYEVLSCGHYQRGVYNEDGLPCSRPTGAEVRSRLCRKCLEGSPKGPPEEIVEP